MYTEISYGTSVLNGKTVPVIIWDDEVVYLDGPDMDFFFVPVWGRA